MKAGNGAHFEQACNAQAAVEVQSRLLVGQRVSDAAKAKEQLVRAVGATPEGAGSVEAVLVDSGFYSEEAVKLEKVSIEWTWVSLAYNLKRMHRMQWTG